MKRREFITLLGGATIWPLAARAQQTMPVVGVLQAAPLINPYLAAFHQGLAEAGFVEGRNVTIDRRSVDGQYERLPALAAEFVRRKVAVIVALAPVSALAAKAATTTIPIVFELGSDPVRDGLVASLARPGGNITGVTFFANLLASKRILHDIVPSASVVGLLLNPKNANAELELSDAQAAARALDVRFVVVRAAEDAEIDTAFAELARQGVAALLVAGDAYLSSRRGQIAALALRHGIATGSGTRELADAGALVSYGADRREASRQCGLYVGRVLKGEKPGDLPVVQPTKFELVINLTTAKALGLTISRELLFRADEVIE
jgi:putative tryptophan/tyrosine transport system substrate-binding protein